MSDPLVKRLRTSLSMLAQEEAADRIEDLEAKLKTSEEIGRAFEEDAGQLRAKLAKAVEAFDCWRSMMNNFAYDMGEMVSEFDALARTTLAELTGGKDE